MSPEKITVYRRNAVIGAAVHERPAQAKPYRTNAWHKCAAAYLKKHPVCAECGTAPSAIAHHIVEVRNGGLMFAEENLMAVCRSCHKRLHDVLGSGGGSRSTKRMKPINRKELYP